MATYMKYEGERLVKSSRNGAEKSSLKAAHLEDVTEITCSWFFSLSIQIHIFLYKGLSAELFFLSSPLSGCCLHLCCLYYFYYIWMVWKISFMITVPLYVAWNFVMGGKMWKM